jgi:hypothetical protein
MAAAADSPAVVEKYNKSIEELKNFITNLSAVAHASIKPLITGSINIDDNTKLNIFAEGIIAALAKLQSETFESSAVSKYPYAGAAIDEIKKIQVAATAVPAETVEPVAGASTKPRTALEWFRFNNYPDSPWIPFDPANDDDNDILSALKTGAVKSNKGINITYKATLRSDGSNIRYATYQGKPPSEDPGLPGPPVTCIYTSQAAFDVDRKIVDDAPTTGGKKSRQSRSRNRNRNRNRSNSAHGSKRR